MRITKPEVKAPKKFKNFGKLPGRPSELIRLALDDLKKAEREKGVKINMYDWYDTRDGVCEVCMAGAVMRARLPIKTTCPIPLNFPLEKEALSAIDSFRTGELAEAFYNLDLRFPGELEKSISIVEYDEDKTKFKRQMAQLATALEKEGY